MNPRDIKNSPVPIIAGVTWLTGGLQPLGVNLSIEDEEDTNRWILSGAHLIPLAGPAPRGALPKDHTSEYTRTPKKGHAFADGGHSHMSALHLAVAAGANLVGLLSCQPYTKDEFKNLQTTGLGLGMTAYHPRGLALARTITHNQVDSRTDFSPKSFLYTVGNNTARVYPFYPPQPILEDETTHLPNLLNKDPKLVDNGHRIGYRTVINKLVAYCPMPKFEPVAA